MINGKSVLAIIPARGGSKGVARKNVRDAGGKPLIAWTIEEAKKSGYIDRLILSSDDAEIIRVAQSWGCEAPFVRPAELARDDTPGIAPIMHAIDALPAHDIVVVLQPTSPLRTAADIDGCLELHATRNANVCMSVTEATQSPYLMYTTGNGKELQPVIATEKIYARRQDMPVAYILNGAVYVANSDWLRQHKTFAPQHALAYEMPQQRSLDIDTELDFQMLEFRLKYPA